MANMKRSRRRSRSKRTSDRTSPPQDAPKTQAEAQHSETEAGSTTGEKRLNAMRDRLYSRVQPQDAPDRTPLSASERARHAAGIAAGAIAAHKEGGRVSDSDGQPARASKQPTRAAAAPSHEDTHAGAHPLSDTMPRPRRTKGYRAKVLFVGIVFFAVALLLSSIFLFFGQNTISGNNIEVHVDAPFAIGGGEDLELAITVTNRNAVPVESATLIVEYPPGTQSADDEGKELFRDRIPLETIKPGETLNVPLEARIFGEENDEKTINISVEYRVKGSNALFYKEANPVRVKVSSSPVVLLVEADEEVSSGQEVVLTLTIASNAPEPISNVLVQASYPFGFDLSEADPDPVRGQNVWSFATLEPESEETIIITGIMTGGSAEARTFDFSVGVPAERDRFTLASIFTTASQEVELTDPFVGLEVTMDNSREETISVEPNDTVNVAISFENTLSDTIYDGSISATLAGNGLNEQNIQVSNGFYNSSNNTITWDAPDVRGLQELTPGERETVRFSIRGANLDATRTPQIQFDVSVRGRRVSENNVPQELTNVVSRTVQFRTVASMSSSALYSTGPFTNSGPTPPVAEQVTSYTVMLNASNGSNELSDATITTTLPQYVSWLNTTTSGDAITYNPSTREVVWQIGDVGAQANVSAAFQISFLPSVSQVDTVPTIVGQQHFRAEDRFTGSVIRASAPALTTSLSDDPDPDVQNGRVQPKE